MKKKDFALYDLFKDIPGLKLVPECEWMTGNNVLFTITPKANLVILVKFLASIGYPLRISCGYNGESDNFSYSLYVAPKEVAHFSPLMKKWMKKTFP